MTTRTAPILERLFRRSFTEHSSRCGKATRLQRSLVNIVRGVGNRNEVRRSVLKVNRARGVGNRKVLAGAIDLACAYSPELPGCLVFSACAQEITQDSSYTVSFLHGSVLPWYHIARYFPYTVSFTRYPSNTVSSILGVVLKNGLVRTRYHPTRYNSTRYNMYLVHGTAPTRYVPSYTVSSTQVHGYRHRTDAHTCTVYIHNVRLDNTIGYVHNVHNIRIGKTTTTSAAATTTTTKEKDASPLSHSAYPPYI